MRVEKVIEAAEQPASPSTNLNGSDDRSESTPIERIDSSWWSRLSLSLEATEDGLDIHTAQDADGQSWRILSAASDTQAAAQLGREAVLAARLNETIAERPARIGEGERMVLAYPARTGSTWAQLPAGAIPLDRFLDIAIAAAQSLSRIHALGIVHGNLGPERLSVEADGRVRFNSFGRATATDMDAPAGIGSFSPVEIAYAAPEQARRHYPYADGRSDLYALGVILYERLVGRLPLNATTTAEWLHAHVAVDVPKPSELRDDVPPGIDAIVLKLVAKDPEQRYQSVESLQADLHIARRMLAETGEVAAFALGRGELAPKASLSNRIFGRAAELADLVGTFDRIRRSGNSELVFISGEAGVGKSALVEQLAKILPAADAHFAIGKGSLLQQGIPYAPFVQALRSIFSWLLSENTDALESTRARLVAGLAGYGRLLTELVPEAEFVLGESAPLPEVSANLAQARIARIILQTCAAVATARTPLILLLDDLQWLDAGSLGVIRAFLGEAPHHMLLIGSYREDELVKHPELAALLNTARSVDVPVTEIRLRPLSDADTIELVSSALNSSPADVGALAQSIYLKTQGNAFYVGQLLQKLVDERVVAFDPERQKWGWDASRLGQQRTVTDFMLRRLDALAPDQREFLRRLASIGGRSPARFLAQLLGRSEAQLEDTAERLLESIFLVRQGTEFLIAHDRVLEAAHALTPEADRPAEHISIARAMIAAFGDDRPDHAFDIATQIERGDRSTLTESERLAFVRVLRTAARRARSAGAVSQAAGYLDAAREMVEPAWQTSHHALFFEVELLHIDCLLALAAVDEALLAIDRLLAGAMSPLDRADAFRLKAIAHTVQSDYERAIDASLAGLDVLGVTLEPSPDAEQLERAYRACRDKLDTYTMAEIKALPEATDPAVRATLGLLSTLISSVFTESRLSFLHTIKIIDLTLEHGATPESAYGFAWFGVHSAHHYGAYEDGAAYALAAQDLVQRDGYEAQRTATLVALDQIIAWTKPMRFALARAREAAQVGRAAGDLGMACYARNHIASDLLIIGEPLGATREEIDEGLVWTREIKYKDIEYILEAQRLLVDTLISGDYDSARVAPEELIVSIPTRFWVNHYAGVTAFLFGDNARALAHLEKAMRLIWAAPAHIDTAACSLFFGLALARSTEASSAPDLILERMAGVIGRFAGWADLNPETFGCKHLLLRAEAARLAGDRQTAKALYEQAADAAAVAGFVHEQALAYEFAAYHYREDGLNIPVEGYVRAACQRYRAWGADGKADRLLRDFPLVVENIGRAPQGVERQNDLDLAVMTKAAQTLSEEIGLEQVIRTLMRDMVVHAGAQFGLLLLLSGDEPIIEASARVEQQEVKVDIHSAPPTARDLPLSVLNTVLRTRKAVVFADAFAEAPRLRISGPDDRVVRSLLCMPLIKRGALIGVLYLENSLAADIFTPNRTAMLEVLAPQAAISIDAARLFKDLVDENTRRTSAELALREARTKLARTSQMTAMGGFAASIAHEINQPLASVVANADATIRWLNRPQPDLGEAMSGLQQIRAAGLRAAGIIKSLRSLSKQAPATLTPARLEDIVEGVLQLTANELDAHRVTVVKRLESAPGLVLADAVQLQQVVVNLITNAIHAMAGNDPAQRHLVVETIHRSGTVHLSISDSGSGMEADVLKRIFEPFFTTKSAGMGIGLAICRSIVEDHGGKLEATSTVGKGSTFFFSLDLAQ
ncbi:AAA family ATPase [Kaistia dalseonensis]|uniref:histidine kinase n=1 Tax=Kaistia dalseonensis TaxID=410840 RepID=A0ABU0HA37_9HYPH|nr:ATP-binding sensor histidine kinase [Kaistia dalseonensis]MCX5495729.1 AAA family ATPase [Kaistia dalseonensis]MDQ0438326.1 putative ATPase/signal transduction histidine kinase [Kaistia dalseonensis]